MRTGRSLLTQQNSIAALMSILRDERGYLFFSSGASSGNNVTDTGKCDHTQPSPTGIAVNPTEVKYERGNKGRRDNFKNRSDRECNSLPTSNHVGDERKCNHHEHASVGKHLPTFTCHCLDTAHFVKRNGHVLQTVKRQAFGTPMEDKQEGADATYGDDAENVLNLGIQVSIHT
jgi:hypothetical protein